MMPNLYWWKKFGGKMRSYRAEELTQADRDAANELLAELRTRISIQPLPYQYGVEERALASLRDVFDHAREAIKGHPGCKIFAQQTTDMLNVVLRPMTAKWHRALTEGRLKARDGCNEFRGDLEAVRDTLRKFATELHQMAYGEPLRDQVAPDVMKDKDLEDCLAELQSGIRADKLIDTDTANKINEAEGVAIAARRRHYQIPEHRKNAVGLGLSGGGIRSATFCLGVVQVLAERELLKDVDYLSTVSGGGYTGSFLTRRLESADAHLGVAAPHGPDPDPVRYLRQHAKYLTASDLKERWSMVTASLAGMLLNWTAPVSVIGVVALAIVAISFGLSSLGLTIPWLMLVGAGSFMIALGLVGYGVQLRYRVDNGAGGFLAFAVAVTAFIGVLWLIVIAYVRLGNVSVATLGGLAGITAAIPTLIRFLPILRKPTVRQLVLKVALIVAGLLIPLGAAALGMLLYYLGMRPAGDPDAFWTPLIALPGWAVLLIVTVTLGLVAVLLLNVNLTGPHRLYRDQLARTFTQRAETDPERTPLTMINSSGFAPYHLINATVNLPSSTSVVLRERKSDFFLFSKAFCGAPSLGYKPTEEWKTQGEVVDLATAMAVSGAAASSYMGLGSYPTLSALLTFLNARLGFWLRRPDGTSTLSAPGFLCLLREMTGFAMSETNRWINLSDGGHIENMALYELLRRRCKFIISIDGEADPESTFQGHLTLVRHAQIDFGIRIEPDLTYLRPDITSKFSQSHAMLARVRYPEGTGLILYLKLSVTGDELEMIKRYRALNPDFPHQTTLDQFFDEEQFEAYRQLGVHVAEGLFVRALMAGNTKPADVADWFRCLAKNLLEPVPPDQPRSLPRSAPAST